MDAPSLNLAGMLIICGAVLAGVCGRNIAVPPPHFEKVTYARWAMWIGLFGGLIAVTSGVMRAVKHWQILVHPP